MKTSSAVLLFALTLAGCKRFNHHEGESGGGSHGTTSTCNVSLSGAQTGAFKCGSQESPIDGPLLTYDQAKKVTDVNLAFNAPGDTPDFQCGLRFDGKPVVGTTYSFASPGADGSAVVHRGDQQWSASSKPVKGALTVTFTTLEGSSSLAGNTVWTTIHGTIVATVPAGHGASGTVDVTASF